MIILDALLHLIYFCAAVVAIFFASLSIGRTVEVKIQRFKARRELRAARAQRSRELTATVKKVRDWQFPPKWKPASAEYVATPMGKTRVGIREKS